MDFRTLEKGFSITVSTGELLCGKPTGENTEFPHHYIADALFQAQRALNELPGAMTALVTVTVHVQPYRLPGTVKPFGGGES